MCLKSFEAIFKVSILNKRMLELLNDISNTVNFLNSQTPKKFVVMTLKFELCGSIIE